MVNFQIESLRFHLVEAVVESMINTSYQFNLGYTNQGIVLRIGHCSNPIITSEGEGNTCQQDV